MIRWAMVLGLAAIGPATATAQPAPGDAPRYTPLPAGPYGYYGFGGPALGVGVVGRSGATVYGLGFGYFGAYSSSWSNGFSLYGPPVPTYGPIPGAFGGSDQRLNLGNPWYRREDSYYALPYRSKPIPIYVVPAAPFQADQRPGPLPPGFDAEQAPVPQPLSGPAPIQFRVELPDADAEVLFDGHATKQTGKTRVFNSPPVPPGRTYTYEITMRWRVEGQPQSETRRVVAAAGQQVRVDFTLPDPAVGGN